MTAFFLTILGLVAIVSRGQSQSRPAPTTSFSPPGDSTVLDVPTRVHLSDIQICPDHQHDWFHIHHLFVQPQPARVGATLLIDAAGVLTQPVTEGARIQITVKYRSLVILDKEYDLCKEAAKQVDRECPLNSGALEVRKEMVITRVPMGVYQFRAAAYDREHKNVVCLEGSFSVGW